MKSGTGVQRLSTAQSAQALLASLNSAENGKLIEVFASAAIETSDTAMNHTLGKARSLDETIRTAAWQLFEAVGSLADHRKPAAEAIMNRISEVLAADEHVNPLKVAVDELQSKALRLLTDVSVRDLSPTRPQKPQPELGDVIVRQAEASDLEPQKARAVLSEIGKELDKGSDLRLSIVWKITRKGGTK